MHCVAKPVLSQSHRRPVVSLLKVLLASSALSVAFTMPALAGEAAQAEIAGQTQQEGETQPPGQAQGGQTQVAGAAPEPPPVTVVITGELERNTIERLPPILGVEIFSGRKTEVINLTTLDANVALKNPREIFAKVPGVFVYDMDGTGNQINISTRGLDPHRGWEFNIRKDGFLTNSDMYAYPASHFGLPLEAVERVDLVRGTGALQYGAQFGGMLNYVTKRAGPEEGLHFESINSAGSFGMLSTYNAVSGRFGSTDFYGYYSKRVSDGYRDSSETEAEYYGLTVNHALTETIDLTAGLAWSEYRIQLAGPLTDAMFQENPRQATRARNYYSPDIYVPSFGVTWTPSDRTTLTWTASAVLGDRNSVLFDRPADVLDGIDPVTLEYANRQVDIDTYRSYTTSLKGLQHYTLWGLEHAFAAGVEFMDNDTHRRQQGVGTTGTDYDLSLVQPGWGRDLHLESENFAFYAENSFALTDRWFVNPGFRIESGTSDMTGIVVGYPPGELPNSIKHNFTLLGISTEYSRSPQSGLYAGWSQAYRPVLFKDIIPSSPQERVDKNLKDARGYTLEAGFRGESGDLSWDVSAFSLVYKNRMGTSAQFDGTDFYNLRTNIGDSETHGVEVFLQYGFAVTDNLRATVFTSTSWMDATYSDNAMVRVGQTNVSVAGNKVQSVPSLISRNGLTLVWGGLSTTLLYSYTDESYADALNTVTPSSNGAVGLVPSYGIFDLSAAYQINENFSVRASINNLTDVKYFTKRPEFYPGPGVWPSDGRSFTVSLGFAY
jgi:Fe(3+) dicitrate transport protein